MKNKKIKNKNQNEYDKASKNLEHCIDNMSNAYSSSDCTGLIPAEPENEAELESYNDIYNYLPADTEY